MFIVFEASGNNGFHILITLIQQGIYFGKAVLIYIAEQIASYAVEGDAWGTAAADAGKTGQTGIPGPAGKDTNDDGVIKDVIKTAQKEFIAAYQEEDYLEEKIEISQGTQ